VVNIFLRTALHCQSSAARGAAHATERKCVGCATSLHPFLTAAMLAFGFACSRVSERADIACPFLCKLQAARVPERAVRAQPLARHSRLHAAACPHRLVLFSGFRLGFSGAKKQHTPPLSGAAEPPAAQCADFWWVLSALTGHFCTIFSTHPPPLLTPAGGVGRGARFR